MFTKNYSSSGVLLGSYSLNIYLSSEKRLELTAEENKTYAFATFSKRPTVFDIIE